MINEIPTLNIIIAKTSEELSKGLMFIKSMPSDAGMLFVFPRSQKLSFWGENTYIPLDIAFINEKNTIVEVKHIVPLSKKPVASNNECKYAIEANYGYFKENKINIGDKIIISNNKIKFIKKDSKEFINKISQFMQDDQDLSRFQNISDYYNYLDENQNNINSNKENSNLPEISQDEIGQYLEDSIQDQKEDAEQEGFEEPEPPSIEDIQPQKDLLEKIPVFSNASEAFNWAKDNNMVMRIGYVTISKRRGLRRFGNNFINRIIEPHGRFTSSPEYGISHEIFVTFDETVGGIRAFRLQNIKQFSILPRNFKPKFIFRPR